MNSVEQPSQPIQLCGCDMVRSRMLTGSCSSMITGSGSRRVHYVLQGSLPFMCMREEEDGVRTCNSVTRVALCAHNIVRRLYPH